MDNFTPHQLLLMKLRDDFCAGNAAELARRKSASDCLGRMGVKYKEIYPAMATKSHPPGQTGEPVKIISRRCPRCPESERPHAATLLHDGSVRLTCKTCGYDTFISAENSKKPTEAWLTQIDAGSRLGQNGKVGGGQVVLPPDKRRGIK